MLKYRSTHLRKELDSLLLLYFYLLEAEDATNGSDSASSDSLMLDSLMLALESSTLAREASFFNLWLLYAATPAIAASEKMMILVLSLVSTHSLLEISSPKFREQRPIHLKEKKNTNKDLLSEWINIILLGEFKLLSLISVVGSRGRGQEYLEKATIREIYENLKMAFRVHFKDSRVTQN